MAQATVKRPDAWQCVLAGGAAGGLESLITYPTEYVKTRQQLLRCNTQKSSPLSVLLSALRSDGVRSIYTGAGVFCISNASKSAVRFTTFDMVRSSLPRDSITGKTSAVHNMFAGLCAGIAESVTVLTPGENLKTKLIDSRAGHGYSSTGQAVRRIIQEQGLAGLYRGLFAVTLKQSANAIVRFTSYNFLLDRTRSLTLTYSLPTATAPAVAGGTAGIVTVYATMPFDNLKTRLQAIDTSTSRMRNIDCLRSIVNENGIKALWKGTTPRLLRLTVSGMLSFTIYEQVIAWTDSLKANNIISNLSVI